MGSIARVTNSPIYACNGKQAFPSYREVELAIKRIRKFEKKYAGEVAAYRCPYCPAWHIGGKPHGRKSK